LHLGVLSHIPVVKHAKLAANIAATDFFFRGWIDGYLYEE
jgi:hypothetical protein